MSVFSCLYSFIYRVLAMSCAKINISYFNYYSLILYENLELYAIYLPNTIETDFGTGVIAFGTGVIFFGGFPW